MKIIYLKPFDYNRTEVFSNNRSLYYHIFNNHIAPLSCDIRLNCIIFIKNVFNVGLDEYYKTIRNIENDVKNK